MTYALIFGIILQSIAFFIFIKRVKSPFASIGFIFFIVAFVYHGISELLQRAFPEYAYYRKLNLVTSESLNSWFLLISFCLFVYSITYSSIYRARKAEDNFSFNHFRKKNLPSDLYIAALTLFLMLNSFGKNFGQSSENVLSDSIYSVYFLLLPLLIAIIVVRFKSRPVILLPLLVTIFVIIGFLGSRFYILSNCIAAIGLLSRFRVTISKKVVGFFFVFLFSAVLVLSLIRTQTGRERINEAGSLTERYQTFNSGASELNDDIAGKSILQDFVYRFDANTFNAYLYQKGKEIGFLPLITALQLAIPSAFWSEKRSLELNEENVITKEFEIYDSTDFTTGLFGSAFSMFGSIGLFLFSILLAVVFAKIDFYIQCSNSLLSIAVQITLLVSVILYEGNFSSYTINGRLLIVFMILLKLLRYFTVFKEPKLSDLN